MDNKAPSLFWQAEDPGSQRLGGPTSRPNQAASLGHIYIRMQGTRFIPPIALHARQAARRRAMQLCRHADMKPWGCALAALQHALACIMRACRAAQQAARQRASDQRKVSPLLML
jgi:hypothetical protein